MKTLSIIDGSGFMFRARYAFPPLLNAAGQNQNVVYGTLRMLLKLISEEADYFVIARDSPTKTKRHEQYQDYKANRKKMEDEFKVQIPLLRELINELQIPNIAAPWYEADDIIATLTKKFQKNSDLMIQVISSDKDLKQLLNENVVVTDPLKNLTTRTPDFEKEFWFPPTSIVDYLALLGDSADNVKWVSGIWAKKASDLIQKYHTIENIYQNLEFLSPDLKNKLKEGENDAIFSKKLIELLEVPELESTSLESLALNIDFQKWEKILVEKRGFKGIKKTFDELKKKYAQPQQLGLF